MTIDLTGVPALTLLNPWAHLIAHDTKRVENRTWLPPESLTRLLIHAGKGWDDDGGWRSLAPDIAGVQPSAVVAVADLAHACTISRYVDQVACDCGPWAMPGQYHWALANVRTLPEPVLCSGRLGLWRPAPDIIAAVAEQLSVVAR